MSGAKTVTLSGKIACEPLVRDLGSDAPSLAQCAKTHGAPQGGRSRPLLGSMDRLGYALHYGNDPAPLVHVVPDDRLPGMCTSRM
jgi:hypothetical protein